MKIELIKRMIYLFMIIGVLNSCGNQKSKSKVGDSIAVEVPTNKVLLSSEIVWEKLNPARGDQSPQAGTIWGDRKGVGGESVATGFLAKFIDGFSSPPHIHNVTYRAVVIEGMVHNDDPNAENMWMSPGSFWTQPLGESHITSAQGKQVMALVEIDKGPYLVKPISEAFDSGERPVNIEASNIVWLDNQSTNWVETNSDVQISFLLEDTTNDLKSLFVKLPKGYVGKLETNGTVLHSVVIKGELKYKLPKSGKTKVLDVGSYFGSTHKAIHNISNKSEGETVIYIRMNGHLKVK
jgi:mannose-6-phosphate isomerase-like protein (cupin superfamily)